MTGTGARFFSIRMKSSRSRFTFRTREMKLLVAGIGNIFFGDDGFGPEVARMLAAEPIDGVTIEDYGIGGLHLAYDLVSGYDRAFLVDARSARRSTRNALCVRA